MKILGHRGIRQEDVNKPYQNTIEALNYAFNKGVDGVEIDVWSNKNNEVIVIHDNEIEIHSNSTVGKITEKNIEEIKRINLDKNKIISKIPTLQEVLEIIPDGKILNIEIKQEGISEYVLKEIKNNNKDNLIISSFKHDELRRIKNSNIKLGILFDYKTSEEQGFYEYLKKLDEEINAYCHIPNCYVSDEKILNSDKIKFFWTIKAKEIEEKLVDKLTKLPNSNFITDYPELLITYIKQSVI